MIIINEYRDDDYSFLEECIEELQKYIVSIDPIKRVSIKEGYKEFYTKKLLKNIEELNGKIFIANKGDKKVGFVAGFIQEQTEENLLELIPTKLGYVADIYVKEECRGEKIGKLLLNKIEQYFKEQNCDSIWIQVVAYNESAHNMYLKGGYSDREIGMLKKI